MHAASAKHLLQCGSWWVSGSAPPLATIAAISKYPLQGWAARLLVSPRRAPPWIKQTATGLSGLCPRITRGGDPSNLFYIVASPTPYRHRAGRPNTGIRPKVGFCWPSSSGIFCPRDRVQVPGCVIAAAKIPCATTFSHCFPVCDCVTIS